MSHTLQNLARASLSALPRTPTPRPTARSPRRPAFLTRALLAACLLLLSAGLARAGSFDGTWVGWYKNETGQKARDSAVIEEKRDGSLEGEWGDMKIRGKRTGTNTADLRCEDAKHFYTITATLSGDKLTFGYHAKMRGSEDEYDGESNFKRE